MDDYQRQNEAYTIARHYQPLASDCQHDWEPYTQQQKWGSTNILCCLKCRGYKSDPEGDNYGSFIERRNAINGIATDNAGHRLGSKGEGQPTPAGYDYDKQ